MNRLRALLSRGLGLVRGTVWWGLGVWTVLAAFFIVFSSIWLASALGLAIAALYWNTRREKFHWLQWLQLSWSAKWRSTTAVVVSAIVAIYFFAFVVPNPNQKWSPEQAYQPHVEILGDKVHVSHVRNFTWHTATDFTAGYYDRVYDVSKLDSTYYVVASMPLWEAVAHVFVCFGFSDGQHVAISVEGRRMEGQRDRLIPSMFRQYQMIYVVGDERDVVGLRARHLEKARILLPGADDGRTKAGDLRRHDGKGCTRWRKSRSSITCCSTTA